MVYLITLLTFLADQLSKLAALAYLPEHQFVPVTSFFNLFLTYNKGVSFSFFSTEKAYGPWLLSLLSIIICMALVYWIYREENKKARLSLALILGGALGNVVDRVRLGAVIDFLDFHYAAAHWPAFNIADTAICCGAALLFVQLFFDKKDKKE